jgi:hypothetical protein
MLRCLPFIATFVYAKPLRRQQLPRRLALKLCCALSQQLSRVSNHSDAFAAALCNMAATYAATATRAQAAARQGSRLVLVDGYFECLHFVPACLISALSLEKTASPSLVDALHCQVRTLAQGQAEMERDARISNGPDGPGAQQDHSCGSPRPSLILVASPIERTLAVSICSTASPDPGLATTVDPDDDVVWGGEAIAKVIKRKPAATFHLLERDQLPARKVGKMWVASRSRLLSYLAGE